MRRSLVLLIVAIFAACTAATRRSNLSAGDSGASLSDAGEPAASRDPLVGTWTFSGQVPAHVMIAVTFSADKTFTFVENVAPATTPAGSRPSSGGCAVTLTISGTYVEAVLDGTSSLTWTMTSATANVITGCSDPASNHEGTPLADEGIDDYIGQGMVPPRTVKYSVDPTTLILNPTVPGNNLSSRTTFQKKSN